MTKSLIPGFVRSFVFPLGLPSRHRVRQFLLPLTLVSLLLPGIAAVAQSQPSPTVTAKSDSQAVGNKEYDAQKELVRMAKRYSLTADQKTKIQPILADQQQQVHALGEDESLSDSEWAGAVGKVHEQTVLKAKLQLTGTQATKYLQDEAKRAKKSQDQTDDDDYGPPPGGGPGGGFGGGPGGGGPPGE